MNILVLGSNGQLGTCLQKEVEKCVQNNNIWYFANHLMVDITKKEDVRTFIKNNKINFVINCAAYTNVEKAEEEYELAAKINTNAVASLATICKEFNIFLIHISTDFVFNGKTYLPYKTTSECDPLNCYGVTKYYGELAALTYEKAMIIRTSWLYSEFGKNFYRTMINRIKEEKQTNVICDQIGTPTYARDLARFLIYITEQNVNDLINYTGVYHFSNNGCCSWYDFASVIEQIWGNKGINEYIKPCKTDEYPSKVNRPYYSVLDKEKLNDISYNVRHWAEALRECIKNDKKLWN